MRKTIRKLTSTVLCLAILLSIVTIAPITVNATEAIKTRDEAVDWLNAQGGKSYNLDTSTSGTQCTEFVKAYVNWLLKGDPWVDAWSGRGTGNGWKVWENSIWSELGWTVYYNTADFLPQPGDIFSSGTKEYGHTGVVISSDLNTAVIADANADSPYNGTPVKIHTVTWKSASSNSAYGATHYIRPNFKSLPPPTPAPSNAWIQCSTSALFAGQSVTFTFGADNAMGYTIEIDKNGSRIITEDVSSGKSYTFNEDGNFSAYVTAWNSSGSVDSNRVSFSVCSPIDVGSVFYAKLAHSESGKFVTQENPNGAEYSNVVLHEDDYEYEAGYQLWRFERQTDVSYKIINTKTGNCLDVSGGGSADETNVISHPSNDTNAQRWYFVYGNGSAFTLVPKCALGSALDLYYNRSEEGTNFQICGRHKESAQLFDIYQNEKLLAETEYNGNKYQLFNNPASWDLAKEICELKGGHLATITSEEEMKAIKEMLQKQSNPYSWIGATSESGSWKWINGEKFSFEYWDSGQPDNAGGVEYYAGILGNNKWNDFTKDYRDVNCYICEFEKIEPVKTAEFNNHKYELYDVSLTWNNSYKICEKLGGHLATVSSKEENDFILSMVKDIKSDEFIWLGGLDREKEGDWYWITGELFEYTNWDSNQPDNWGG